MDSCFPEPVLQDLYDTGLLREASIEALAHAFASEGALVTDLFRAGEGLAREIPNDSKKPEGYPVLH